MSSKMITTKPSLIGGKKCVTIVLFSIMNSLTAFEANAVQTSYLERYPLIS